MDNFLSQVPVVPGGNAWAFNKSPVFSSQSDIAYPHTLITGIPQFSTSPRRNFDTHRVPVTLTGTTNGLLENSYISVWADQNRALTRAQRNPKGYWAYSSMNDSSSRLGQVNAYYWLMKQRDITEEISPGSFWADGEGIDVFTRCAGAGPNAYFSSALSSGNPGICVGYLNEMELSYDASIFVHEMAHANIFFATSEAINEDVNFVSCRNNGSSPWCCPKVGAGSEGCSRAIDEGQADVFNFIVFNDGHIAEFLWNSIYGFEERDAVTNTIAGDEIRLDEVALDQPTAQPWSGREVHVLGGVWNAAWWNLRKALTENFTDGQQIADEIFFAHLELLGGDDTFTTALDLILEVDEDLYDVENHRPYIIQAFSRHAIYPTP